MLWWPYGAAFALILAVLASMLAPGGIAGMLAMGLAVYAVWVAVTGASGM